MDFIILVALMLTAGLLSGLLAGLLGVGGGIVIVPVLVFAFSWLGVDDAVLMQLALGSSLATILCTGFVSARSHRARGNLNTDTLCSWAPIVLIGVMVGSLIADRMSANVLRLIFSLIATSVALWFLFGPSSTEVRQFVRPKAALWYGSGLGLGIVSALMGIGAGTIGVPLLTVLGEATKRAVGTAAALGVAIGLVGTISFLVLGWDVPNRPWGSLGYINLVAVASVIPTAAYMAPVGARLVSRLDDHQIKCLFAIFLLVVAGDMLRRVLS